MKLKKCKLAFISILISSTACAGVSSNQIQSWQKKDGYLVFANPQMIEKLDPRSSFSAHSRFMLPLIYEALIALNSQLELIPVLAKSWMVAPDGKSITVTLKPNHRFSDGSEVTSHDVYRSVNRICSKGSKKYGELRGLNGCMEHANGNKKKPEVYVVDKYRVKFNINSSPTTFLNELSSPTAVITKQTISGLIGSAPYLIQKHHPEYLILGLNPFYSGDVNVRNKGIILFHSDGKHLFKTLKDNHPDGALMYRMESLWNFSDDHFKLIKSNPNITEIFVPNNQRFPFNYSIVRKALAAEIFNNFDTSCIAGGHHAYGIIPNGIGGSINNMPPASLPLITPQEVFSAVPALRHKRASITLHELDDIKNDCTTRQLISIAKKYHIDIKFKYHKDYSEYQPQVIKHDLDGMIDLYVFKNREASKVFEYFSKTGDNDANVAQNGIDVMLHNAIIMPSSHSRFQAYRKISMHMQDNNIAIPLFYMDHGNLMNKCLSGISEDFFFNPYSHLPILGKSSKCNKYPTGVAHAS
ncbi:MAG TPA: ABC transporter substrate-binding protein [Gammaproteobacteria bacterium]|jgi:ABC-type transport system substrate-binding protein|nr:ABC transporter substrate-binding protein [Gammaproteobacteria bacterium]